MVSLFINASLILLLYTNPEFLQGDRGPQGETGAQGEKGENGINGKDGETPTIEISADGYWVINGTKTEYKAIGAD